MTRVVLGVAVGREFPINESLPQFLVVVQIGRGVIDDRRRWNKGAVVILDLKVGDSDQQFVAWHHGRSPHSAAIDEGSVPGIQIMYQHRPLNHFKLAMQLANPRIRDPNVRFDKASQNEWKFMKIEFLVVSVLFDANPERPHTDFPFKCPQ